MVKPEAWPKKGMWIIAVGAGQARENPMRYLEDQTQGNLQFPRCHSSSMADFHASLPLLVGVCKLIPANAETIEQPLGSRSLGKLRT